MKVFWSWQNDVMPNQNRHFIRAALAEAVERVGDEFGLEDAARPELDHDTKNTPGMADITETILEKISRSAAFVADLTPIGATAAGKVLPNPNVLIELGWALSKLGPDRIIAILNLARGYEPDHLPFDIRQRRALLYTLGADADRAARKIAKQKLVRDLTEALRINLGQYAEDQAATQEIQGVAAKPDDPSIWASATDQLEHHDTMRGVVSRALPSCARGYIRIIPAGWKNGIPAVSVIASMDLEEAVWPVPMTDGDFGICEEGYVRYWLTGRVSDGEFETSNVAMWFDKNGEFWVIHGTAIRERKGGRTALDVPNLIRGWHDSLRRAMAIYDRLGAFPARKVEVGLTGVRGALWPSQFASDSIPARKGQCVHKVQRRDWSADAQLGFLTDAYNKIGDLFGRARVDQKEVRKLLQ